MLIVLTSKCLDTNTHAHNILRAFNNCMSSMVILFKLKGHTFDAEMKTDYS